MAAERETEKGGERQGREREKEKERERGREGGERFMFVCKVNKCKICITICTPYLVPYAFLLHIMAVMI